MTTKSRWLFVVSLLILAGAAIWRPSLAQTSEQQYFPETGHWITGEFFKTYQSAKDPLVLYGYPITEAYQDPTTGRIVQYFQRARFELYSDAPEGQRVHLAPLGDYTYNPGPGIPLPENSPACQSFFNEAVGKEFQVCFAFLDFFNEYGGVEQFGLPLSNFETHDERIVQYFQRARFEWHPEYPPGQRVSLTDLGRRYFDLRGENPGRLLASQDNNVLPTILSLRARAFPLKAVTSLNGEQTVYVAIQDQKFNPVSNVQVTLTVQTPTGEAENYTLPLTDEHGITRQGFSFKSGSTGIARVTVTAAFGDLQAKTKTSFRIWW